MPADGGRVLPMHFPSRHPEPQLHVVSNVTRKPRCDAKGLLKTRQRVARGLIGRSYGRLRLLEWHGANVDCRLLPVKPDVRLGRTHRPQRAAPQLVRFPFRLATP
jgi:hypothetical protein